MSFMLRLSDVWDENDIATGMRMGGFEILTLSPEVPRRVQRMHFTPEMAIQEGWITQEQLEEYNVFCTIREPGDRYISMYTHANRRIADKEKFRLNAANDFDYGLLEKRQKLYVYSNGVKVCDMLDFGNFEQETKRMLKTINGDFFPIIPKMNDRANNIPPNQDRSSFIDDATQAIIDVKFAEDIQLYNDMKAGTVPLTL